MSAELTQIFVYGTLQRGCSNHGQLAGQRFLGSARTQDGYRLYQLDGYPGMVTGGGRPTVSIPGEIWAVDPAALARLDQFEGVDEGLYVRLPVLLAPPHDRGRVMTYFYLRDVKGRPELARWGAAGGEPR